MPAARVKLDFNKTSFRGKSGQYIERDAALFRKAVRYAARAGAAAARAEAPEKSGALRASISGRASGSVAKIESSSPYALTINSGHPRLRIDGRMSFYWESRNRWFGKPYPNTVTRPAFKPKRFMEHGLDVAQESMIGYLEKRLGATQ